MLITSWNPGFAIFKSPRAWGELKIDLDRFSRAIRDELKPGPSALKIKPRIEDVANVVKDGFVAVDVEAGPDNPQTPWTAKYPGLARLRCVGLGNTDWGLSHRWTNGSGPVVGAIRNLLSDPKVKKVYQNGIWYDQPLLRRYKLPTVNYDDTRDMRRALSATSRLGLKYLATLYDDVIPWAEEDEEDDEKLIFTQDWNKLLTYNAYDCVETARIYVGMQREEDWNTDRVQTLYQTHLSTSLLAAEMRHRGLYIDKKEKERLADLLEREYEVRERVFLEQVGIKGFKHNPNHMRALIFKRHETEAIKRFSLPDPYDKKMYTPDGDNIRVDHGTLLNVYVDPGTPKDLRSIIVSYWHADSAWKARSTFVASDMINRAIGYDGYIRPDWNSCGADTGRWSCRGPNVMTIPKDNDGLPNIRRMYAAPPGFILIEADYKQQELYVRMLVARDEALKEGLKNDVYTEDAKSIFRLPAGTVRCKCEGTCTNPEGHLKDSVRKAAKTGHLGFAYAAGTDALYMQMLETDNKLKYSTVDVVHRGLKERYHRTVSYWYEEQARVKANGYSESRIFHRRRYYPREPPITEVANYPIQSTAADITTIAMLDLDRLLKKEKLKRAPGGITGQFHDALLICVPDTAAWHRRGVELLKEAMEQPHVIDGQSHKFMTDVKIGPNWADMREVT